MKSAICHTMYRKRRLLAANEEAVVVGTAADPTGYVSLSCVSPILTVTF